MCSDYDLCSGPHVGEAAPSTLQKPSDGLQRALTLKGSITSVLMEKKIQTESEILSFLGSNHVKVEVSPQNFETL